MKAFAYYLSVEEALELHRLLISEFGGRSGVRDLGLVESAVHRPQSGYYATLSMQAAALLQSFALGHAFIDGNNRMAFAATAVFLSANGFKLELTAKDGEAFLVQKVIQDKLDVEGISKWLEARMRAKR